ncbi:MAG: peptidoglycan glycosyltransferase, partial [Proteobacteria bacterium]|nr:peptidoglycan glycosyltransferase [Pseudomonadota bacterium]
MKRAAARDHAPSLPAWRANLVLLLLAAWFIGLAGRALWLQALNNDFLQRKGESRYSRVIEIGASRGMIVDRNNEPLAISTPVESVAASPADVEAEPAELRRLAQLLGISGEELRSRLADTQREFVYLKRQLPPEQAERVVQLGIPGVFLQREHRRYYPAGEVMSHIIGFTGVDDKGQEALELAFEETLGGKPGSRRVIKDRLGRIVEDVES